MNTVQRLDGNLHYFFPSLHNSMSLSSLEICNYWPRSTNSKSLDKIKYVLLAVDLHWLSSISRNRILGINHRQSIILKNKNTPGLLPETGPHIFKWHPIVQPIRKRNDLSKSMVYSLLKQRNIDALLLFFVRVKIRRKLKPGDSLVHCFQMLLVECIRSKEQRLKVHADLLLSLFALEEV